MGRVVDQVKNALSLPQTRGMSLDDPRTTALRLQIVRSKPSLERIYREWYRALIAALPAGPGRVLELGSGAGFLRELLPEVITSEIFPVPTIAMVADAQRLPLGDRTLRGILMTDVLHHIPNPRAFLAEAARCVRPGGVIAMVEPWVTRWSRLIYQNLHHEPFEPETPEWSFPSSGPLSGSNGAMPWIIFDRDRQAFEAEFPMWRIRSIKTMMPIRYLLTGGVSLRNLVPWGADYPVKAVEALFSRQGMFALVVLERQ